MPAPIEPKPTVSADELLAKLTAKQRQFVLHYLDCLNATEAARRAGYSEKTAYSIGSENLRKPELVNAISALLEQVSMSAGEAILHLSDIAASRINDYLIIKDALKTPQVRKPLAVLIEELEKQIAFENEYFRRAKLDEKLHERFHAQQAARQDQILRYQIELEQNPAAYRDVDGEANWVEDVSLDLVGLAKSRRKGRIKSLSWTEYGPKIEFYAADSALEKILQLHGRFVQKIEAKVEGAGEDIEIWSAEDVIAFQQWKAAQS